MVLVLVLPESDASDSEELEEDSLPREVADVVLTPPLDSNVLAVVLVLVAGSGVVPVEEDDASPVGLLAVEEQPTPTSNNVENISSVRMC